MATGSVSGPLSEDPARRIARLEKELQAAIKRQSLEFRNEVARQIEQQIKRKADSSGRLVQLTRSPGNVHVDVDSWAVPNAEFLDGSLAKYWRTIEQGSLAVWKKPFRGTALKFNPGGFGGGRMFRSFPANQQSALRVKPSEALSQLGITQRTAAGRGVRIVYVRNEIAPMHAYSETWQRGNWRQRIDRDFRDIARNLF